LEWGKSDGNLRNFEIQKKLDNDALVPVKMATKLAYAWGTGNQVLKEQE
jgi:hypothetical protein